MSELDADEPTKTREPAPPPGDGAPPPNGARKQPGVGDAVWTGVREAGAPVYRFLDVVGGHLILVARAFKWLPRRPFRLRNYLDAAEYIGFGSLSIVLLVGASTGMVLSLQSVNAFRQFGLESFAGGTT